MPGVETQDLARLLAELRAKAGQSSKATNQNASFTYMDQVSKILGIKIRNFHQIARRNPYRTTPKNYLLNQYFQTDLTSWTESIPANITATTSRSQTQDKVYSEHLSIASLKLNITGGTATGKVRRYQDVTAAATEIWSFEANVLVDSLTNTRAVFQIEWLDAADAVIGSAVVTNLTTVSTSWAITGRDQNPFAYTFPVDFTLAPLWNQTAPALTAKVRVSLILEVTTAGGTGTVYWGGAILACKTTYFNDWAERGITHASKANKNP